MSVTIELHLYIPMHAGLSKKKAKHQAALLMIKILLKSDPSYASLYIH